MEYLPSVQEALASSPEQGTSRQPGLCGACVLMLTPYFCAQTSQASIGLSPCWPHGQHFLDGILPSTYITHTHTTLCRIPLLVSWTFSDRSKASPLLVSWTFRGKAPLRPMESDRSIRICCLLVSVRAQQTEQLLGIPCWEAPHPHPCKCCPCQATSVSVQE